MTRPPPTPPLFPYTTLFRSKEKTNPPRLHKRHCASKPAFRFTGTMPLIDRKSTRLNSSHVRISYAVFCLKKKDPLPLSGKSLAFPIVDLFSYANNVIHQHHV